MANFVSEEIQHIKRLAYHSNIFNQSTMQYAPIDAWMQNITSCMIYDLTMSYKEEAVSHLSLWQNMCIYYSLANFVSEGIDWTSVSK